jgi:uncharacterized membrane protein YhiD involved in acid resistance
MRFKLDTKRKREVFTLLVVFLGVLMVSALAVYLIAGGSNRARRSAPAVAPTEETQPSSQVRPTEGVPVPERTVAPDSGFLSELFRPETAAHVTGENWGEVAAKITLRLLLAALLGAALAFRPRREILSMKRNPYVAQTQILLAVVASALMIIVGDNAARAFGIFAAVSLVRFRTNIRDPKEITVLLISLAIGLATGVGRWDLGVILAVFSLILLWLIEYREPEQVFRSMELKIVTRSVAATHAVLQEAFDRHGFQAELRTLSQEGDAPGTIIHSVDITPAVSTDQLSAEILSKDTGNVESIEWEQKKSFSYLYQ